MHIGSNIGCSWLEIFIHSPITVNEPFSDFQSFTRPIMVLSIVLNNASKYIILSNTWQVDGFIPY
jgi:hypothetical protein